MPSVLEVGRPVRQTLRANGKPKWIPRAEYLKRKFGPPSIQYVDYAPRGACKELFRCKDTELILAGPAGTGKSRACLEKVHWLCDQFKDLRALMIRKTRRSLTQSGMVTFDKEVLPASGYVPFHGGDQEYRYPNGAILAVGGMDDPQKILSSQWDIVYAQQAEELDESAWEAVISRLRNNKMPYQQIIGDVNPAAPTHWIKARQSAGKLTMLESRHEDNPVLWDGTVWTEKGTKYLANLDAMTGVLYLRLRKGIWAAAEGLVYEESWAETIHVIPRFPIPASWPRYWAIDFGFTNPFVWQAWAADPDGRLYRYRELYQTKLLVEDAARKIRSVTEGEPKPQAIICDHDAEDRATLERHLGEGYKTKPAWKSVKMGIQAVEARLRKAGDGKPRIFFLEDSLVQTDATLLSAHLPVCTEQEMSCYVWNDKAKKEEPVKEFDHGADALRYVVTHVDKTGSLATRLFAPTLTSAGGAYGYGSENAAGNTGRLPDVTVNRPSPWRMGTMGGRGSGYGIVE